MTSPEFHGTPCPSLTPSTGTDIQPDAAVVSVPAMLASPLIVHATVLRKPDYFEQMHMPEMAEEGDILYDVLRNPFTTGLPAGTSSRTSNPSSKRGRDCVPHAYPMGVCPLLCLPDKIGKYFVGEPFRAFIVFVNSATYALSSAVVYAEITPPKPQRMPLYRREIPVIKAKGSYAITVDAALAESGMYKLSVWSTYTDPTGQQRRLSWASSFSVERAIIEVGRTLRLSRFPLPLSSTALSSGAYASAEGESIVRLAARKYFLSLTLENRCTTPLVVTNVRVVLKEPEGGQPAWILLSSTPMRTNTFIRSHPIRAAPSDSPRRPTTDDACAGAIHLSWEAGWSGRGDDVSHVPLNPHDRHVFSFELLYQARAIRPKVVMHQDCTTTAVFSPHLFELGYAEWHWHRSNGDGGVERSSPLQLSHLSASTTVDLLVVRLCPAGEGDGESLRAGQQVNVECIVVYYEGKQPLDLALKVRPEKLAPDWIYAGQVLRPLGLLDPGSTISFTVTLLPWRTGWLRLDDGLQIVDSQEPEKVLWPLPLPLAHQLSLGDAVSSSLWTASRAGSPEVTTVEGALVPEEVLPPTTLAEVLVV